MLRLVDIREASLGFERWLGEQRRRILSDLGRRKSTWLTKAAEHMGEAVTRDWRQWRK